jgi:BASS family bile acid:Na+ symporter
MEILKIIFQITVPLFVVSSMLAMGLSLTVGQIIEPLKNRSLVGMSLLANFVVLPLLTLLMIRLLPLSEGVSIGLILLSLAAGAPFLPKLACIANSDKAFSIALMLLLMVVTVFYMPLLLPLFLSGVSVSPLEIAKSLIVLMLIPLVLALYFRARLPVMAQKILSPLTRLSNIALLLLIISVIMLNFKSLLQMHWSAWLGIFLFLVIGIVTGWFLGGKEREKCVVLSLGTAQRNIAAALIVGKQSFHDPQILLTLVAVAILGLLIMIPYAGKLGKCTV